MKNVYSTRLFLLIDRSQSFYRLYNINTFSCDSVCNEIFTNASSSVIKSSDFTIYEGQTSTSVINPLNAITLMCHDFMAPSHLCKIFPLLYNLLYIYTDTHTYYVEYTVTTSTNLI